MRIYQAGPLFSEAERNWHRALRSRLVHAGYLVTWPYDLCSPQEIQSWGEAAPKKIMEACRDALEGCDVVVALLDGTQVDDGTAWEIGYAHARGKVVVGIRTDFRQAGDTQYSVVNAMIEDSCNAIVRDVDELLQVLKGC
ncbi:nucleoside 2-deoxyribosyltransferase [Nitratidesulfovibrio vulgaris]|nr:nucleoside 2-deoxyribosyltransferase [Nitratidesulfovibrio vulgaris]